MAARLTVQQESGNRLPSVCDAFRAHASRPANGPAPPVHRDSVPAPLRDALDAQLIAPWPVAGGSYGSYGDAATMGLGDLAEPDQDDFVPTPGDAHADRGQARRTLQLNSMGMANGPGKSAPLANPGMNSEHGGSQANGMWSTSLWPGVPDRDSLGDVGLGGDFVMEGSGFFDGGILRRARTFGMASGAQGPPQSQTSMGMGSPGLALIDRLTTMASGIYAAGIDDDMGRNDDEGGYKGGLFGSRNGGLSIITPEQPGATGGYLSATTAPSTNAMYRIGTRDFNPELDPPPLSAHALAEILVGEGVKHAPQSPRHYAMALVSDVWRLLAADDKELGPRSQPLTLPAHPATPPCAVNPASVANLLATKLVHPDEFKNPSTFLKIYGDPLCSGSAAGLPRKGKDGNWECAKCGNVNFPRRFRCNKCSTLRDDQGDRLVSDYARVVFDGYFSPNGVALLAAAESSVEPASVNPPSRPPRANKNHNKNHNQNNEDGGAPAKRTATQPSGRGGLRQLPPPPPPPPLAAGNNGNMAMYLEGTTWPKLGAVDNRWASSATLLGVNKRRCAPQECQAT